MSLSAGQLALVTGASGGIGRAIAVVLAQEGVRVMLVGRNEEELRNSAALAGNSAHILKADITTVTGRQAIADATRPELHFLIHSAGAFSRGSIADMEPQAWAALDLVNLHAPILLTAACLPQLKAGAGQIAMINSTAALQSRPDIAAYAAGKRALQTATDILRSEVNPYGIRVISIFPGRTRTEMQKKILAAEGRIAGPDTLLDPNDVASILLAALKLPRNAEVTDIVVRPMRSL